MEDRNKAVDDKLYLQPLSYDEPSVFIVELIHANSWVGVIAFLL